MQHAAIGHLVAFQERPGTLQHLGLLEALPAVDRRRPYRLSDRGATVLAAQLEALQQVATTGLRRLGRE